MTDVDDLLTRAGARWRAAQPPPPDPDLTGLTGRSPRRPKARILPPLVAAAAVVVVAAGALVALDRDPAPPPGPVPAAPPDPDRYGGEQIVHVGDRVVADGFVVRDDGVTWLCVLDVIDWHGEVHCRRDLVLTGPGYASRAVPWPRKPPSVGLTTTEDAAATVYGRYRPGGIEVDRVVEVTLPQPGWGSRMTPSAPREVPCAPPAGGWTTGHLERNSAPELAMERLVAQGQDYSGTWPVFPADDTVVHVVATTGDVDTAEAELRRVLPEPYNLCVYRTSVRREQLERAPAGGEELGRLGLGSRIVLDVGRADGFRGLTGNVVVLDETTVDWLRRWFGDLFIPRPAVRLDR